MPDVVLLHGLESPISPEGVPIGTKAVFLRRELGASTPHTENQEAIELLRRFWGRLDELEPARLRRVMEGPLARARAALGPDCRVAVGSSFGGALLLSVLHERSAAGEPLPGAVLLAGAGPKLTGLDRLPPGLRCALIHSLSDDVVPVDGSIRLFESSPDASLLLVQDEHGLPSIVGPPLLRSIAWCRGEEPPGHPVAGVLVRPEAPGDEVAVRRVHRAAFPSAEEAALVDAVRGTDDAIVSLVAERGGAVVGHALFLRVTVGDRAGAGLAPLAVHPDHQGDRIGAWLAVAGQDALRSAGVPFCVVLGEPGYYDRLGWRDAAAVGIGSEYDAPPGAFRVLALTPGGLDGVAGTARYPAVLSQLGV